LNIKMQRATKEAVPSRYCIKSPTKGQGAHIADDPLLVRHPCPAERCQRGRTIQASHAKALRDHVKRNRRTTAAAEIENSRAARKKTQEALDKGPLDPIRSTAVGVP
jgi:hypothetical protein